MRSPQPVINDHNAQRIQQLALVFVNSFYLRVEDRVRIYGNLGCGCDPLGKLQLRIAFRFTEGVPKIGIVSEWLQLTQLTQVGNPTVSYCVSNFAGE